MMKTKPRTIFIAAALVTVLLLAGCGTGGKQTAADHGGQAEPTTGGGHAGHDSHASGGSSESSAALQAEWKLSKEKPAAGETAQVTVQIRDADGKPVEKFDVNHEKLMHLIVVSKDLSHFAHLHPDYRQNGLFQADVPFPTDGEYKLIADFIPAGGTARTETHWVAAGSGAESPSALQPDASLVKTVDGKEVALTFDKLKAGQETTMTFTIKDAQSKAPITNLQPYLGAVGHVVVISGDAEQYLHNHPLDESAKGPNAAFATTFPKAGLYKIWGQFQHEGRVFTVPFTINVP
ncbi:hypothetical protein [Paenibacillus sp.]|uniref:hypothetical protein n=1 Tax=Paenibacillus sp. TaxID=58172 RepID=UPI00356676CE